MQGRSQVGVSLERVAFSLTVLAAGMIFWISPRAAMVDLPQHAAQITLWKDLLLGRSEWDWLVEINLFTPYLLGYSSGLLLSFFMPVAIALKLLLTIAYLAFVLCCILLRRAFGSDSRLDWLFIVPYFGFAYSWGFFTFLLSCPLALFFIWLANSFSLRKSAGLGIGVSVLSVLLFFSHGLVFLFANAIGIGLLAARARGVRRFFTLLFPYVLPAILCAAYFFVRVRMDLSVVAEDGGGVIAWNSYVDRVKLLLFPPVGAPRLHPWLAIQVPLCLMLPLIFGSRLNRHCLPAFVAMAAFLVAWFSVPNSAFSTTALIERFQVFFLPFYALLFTRGAEHDARPSPLATARLRLGSSLVMVSTVVWLGALAKKELAFREEAADFDVVMAAAQPGQRALGLVLEPFSNATRSWHYLHFPLWYQAERHGFVDFNFAYFLPMVVRFRRGLVPPDVENGGWDADEFDWQRSHGSRYRYFFVRNEGPGTTPANLFPQGTCRPSLVKASGRWSLYENVNCYKPAPGKAG